MPKIKFTGKPYSEAPKGAWTFMTLPKDVTEFLGSRARVPVVVTVKGYSFRTSAFPDGKGGHTISWNKHVRAATNVGPG